MVLAQAEARFSGHRSKVTSQRIDCSILSRVLYNQSVSAWLFQVSFLSQVMWDQQGGQQWPQWPLSQQQWMQSFQHQHDPGTRKMHLKKILFKEKKKRICSNGSRDPVLNGSSHLFRSSGLGSSGPGLDSPKGVNRSTTTQRPAQWPGHPRP